MPPMFDFKCEQCSHVFDDLVKLGTTDVVCPKCGGNATKQVSNSTGGFRIDGEGVYRPSASSFGEKEIRQYANQITQYDRNSDEYLHWICRCYFEPAAGLPTVWHLYPIRRQPADWFVFYGHLFDPLIRVAPLVQ